MDDEQTMVTFDEFKKLDIRIGTVVEASDHPNADRLLLVKVDLGEEQPRQVVAGIKAAYPPETLVGRQVVVLTNLEPATLRGEVSNGMLLAASGADQVKLLTPDGLLPPGSTVS